MKQKCLYCEKEFEAKTDKRKFCSDSCRVMNHRKHGKKAEIKPFQMQVIYNQILEAINKIGEKNELPPAVGVVVPGKAKWTTREIVKDFSYFNRLIKELDGEDECREFVAEVQVSGCTDREKRILIETLKNKWQ